MKYYKLYLPSGKTQKLYYDETTDKNEIVSKISSEWAEYCEDNWLSADHKNRFCGESQVKRFMDSLTGFLFVGSQEGVLSSYKENRNKNNEVLLPHDGSGGISKTGIAGISPEVMKEASLAHSAFRSKTQATKDTDDQSKNKTKHGDSLFSRMNKIKKKNKGVVIEVCIVDTDNIFEHKGVRYAISKKVTQYDGKETSSGLRYDQDRIIVGTMPDGRNIYCDQFGHLLMQEYITKVNDDIDDNYKN